MKKKVGVTCALAVLLSALGLVALGAGKAPSPAKVYGATVTASPGKVKDTDGIRFVFRVTELESNSVLAGSDLTVRPGETANAKSEDPDSKTEVNFTASLSEDRKVGKYSIAIKDREKLSGRYEGEIRLPLK